MRYPPDGGRGLALSTRGAGLGALGHTDIQAINRRILGIIQIESPSAVEHAAEIAAIDGVDVLFVGPTDLSHSLGVPGRFDDPGYLAALERVTTAAEARRQGGRDPAARPRLPCPSTATSGSGSSASARTGRSSATERGPCWTPPGADPRRPRPPDRRVEPSFVGHAHGQRRRPLGRRPGLGDHDADEDQRAARRAGPASGPPGTGSPPARSSRSARRWRSATHAPRRRAGLRHRTSGWR